MWTSITSEEGNFKYTNMEWKTTSLEAVHKRSSAHSTKYKIQKHKDV